MQQHGKGTGLEIKHFTFSDSTVFISDAKEPQDIIKIVSVMSGMFASLLMKDIPSRGAIAIGESYVCDELNFVVGIPYIQAITIAEDVLDSAGIAFVISDEQHKELWKSLFEKGWLSEKYSIPLKKGAEENLKTIHTDAKKIRMIKWFNSSLVPKDSDSLAFNEDMDGSILGLKKKLKRLYMGTSDIGAKKKLLEAIAFIELESL